MPDDGGWQVRVECSAVKQLPTPLVNRLGGKSSIHLRVQGSVGGARRETGPSTWGGKGTPRAGEGVWSREDGCLIWNFDSIESLKELERRSPKLKLHCYATRGMEPSLQDSEALGSVVLEVADIRRHPQPGSIWAKLKGTNESTAELLYSARCVSWLSSLLVSFVAGSFVDEKNSTGRREEKAPARKTTGPNCDRALISCRRSDSVKARQFSNCASRSKTRER